MCRLGVYLAVSKKEHQQSRHGPQRTTQFTERQNLPSKMSEKVSLLSAKIC
jgi:hypothetical protein